MGAKEEFQKFLVAGYNACAISKVQFAELRTRFEVLDMLSRQINSFVGKPELSESDKASLSDLVNQYIIQTQQLAAGAKR